MRRLAFVAVIVLCWMHSGCRSHPASQPVTGAAPVVRVLLMSQISSANLAATANPMVQVGDGSARSVGLSTAGTLPISHSAGRWTLGQTALGTGVLIITPAADGTLQINGKRYRGKLRFIPRNDTFDVINDVDIEGYLKGVIARELLRHWHPEAYRAQAVAARTYALFQIRTRSDSREFDVYDDTRSQVYGGMADETDKSVHGVDTTRGLVLATGPEGRERIFKAYYSACCGGVTQSAQDAFNDPIVEPLQAQYVGPVCGDAPRFNWGPIVFTKAELTRRIRAYGARRNGPERNIADVRSIEIARQNEFGRPVQYIVTDTRGTRFAFNSEQMRWAINTDPAGGATIHSGFFKPVNEANTIRLVEGHGHGHGVGLCQYCTQARATQNQRYDLILKQAYPGAKILRAY